MIYNTRLVIKPHNNSLKLGSGAKLKTWQRLSKEVVSEIHLEDRKDFNTQKEAIPESKSM